MTIIVNGYEIKPSANLGGAYLYGADLKGAYLEDANLKGTILEKKEDDGFDEQQLLHQSRLLIEGDTITYLGTKYKKVDEPKTLYNKIWEVVADKVGNNTDADYLTDRIMDLFRENLPKEQSAGNSENEYVKHGVEAFNTCIKEMKEQMDQIIKEMENE